MSIKLKVCGVLLQILQSASSKDMSVQRVPAGTCGKGKMNTILNPSFGQSFSNLPCLRLADAVFESTQRSLKADVEKARYISRRLACVVS